MTEINLNTAAAAEAVKKVTSYKRQVDISKLKGEYDPEGHAVMDLTKRPNKKVASKPGQTKEVPVARLPLSFQKIIVNRAQAFLFTNPVAVKLETEDLTNKDAVTLLEMVKYILKKNKANSLNSEIARTLFSQTAVAEYWYPVEDETFWKKFLKRTKTDVQAGSKFRLRCMLFSPFAGDTLYPVFDQYNDMIAFGRGYTIAQDGVKTEYLDLFTPERIRRFKNDKEKGWIVESDQPNILKKIPVVYYSQDETEWSDVQHLIERLETLLSNFSDTNDYFAAPMVKVKGKVTGFAEKNDTGKVITISDGGDASYLTWEQAPDAIKLEIDTLQNFIFSLTQTPDISFKTVQGISNISGIALKLLFLDAYLKAVNKLEVFDEAMARRLSILKGYCTLFNKAIEKGVSDVDLEAEITPYIPESLKEVVDMLSSATGGRQIISQATAVGMTGLVENVDAELDKIKQEQTNDIGESFV